MTEETKDTQKQPIWVASEKCKSCGDCVLVCPFGVLAMKKNPKSLESETVFVLHSDYCTGCGLCVRVCPEPFAIHLKEKTEFVFPKKSAVALAREKNREARLRSAELQRGEACLRSAELRQGEGGGK